MIDKSILQLMQERDPEKPKIFGRTPAGIPVDTMRTANDPRGGNVRIDRMANTPYADTLMAALEAHGVPKDRVRVGSYGTPGYLSDEQARNHPNRTPWLMEVDVGTPTGYETGQFVSGPIDGLDDEGVMRQLDRVMTHEGGHLVQNAERKQRTGESGIKAGSTGFHQIARMNRERDANRFTAVMEAMRTANSFNEPIDSDMLEDIAYQNYLRYMDMYDGVGAMSDEGMEREMIRDHIGTLRDKGVLNDVKDSGFFSRLKRGIGALSGG